MNEKVKKYLFYVAIFVVAFGVSRVFSDDKYTRKCKSKVDDPKYEMAILKLGGKDAWVKHCAETEKTIDEAKKIMGVN